MLISTLCLVVLINQVIDARACQSTYSVANMCQSNSVQGQGVTLDVSTASTSGYSNCTCVVSANMTGFLIDFKRFPNATDCGAQLDILLDDKSMQLKCGALHQGQSTTGSSAQVVYTRSQGTTNIDSDYCVSFHSNYSNVEFTLTCSIDVTTTTSDTPLPTTKSVTLAPTQQPTTTEDFIQTTSVMSHSSTDTAPSSTMKVQTSTATAVTPPTVHESSSSVTSTFSDIPTTTASITSTTLFIVHSTTTSSTDANGTVTVSLNQTTVNKSFSTSSDITRSSVILKTIAQNTTGTITSFTTHSATPLDNVTSSTDSASNTKQFEYTTTERINQTTDNFVTDVSTNTPTTVENTSVFNGTTKSPTSTQANEYNVTTVQTNITQATANTSTTVEMFNNSIGPNTTDTLITTVDPFLSNITTTFTYDNNTMKNNNTNSMNTTDYPSLLNKTTTTTYDNHTMDNTTINSINSTTIPNLSNVTTIEYENNTMVNHTTDSANTTTDLFTSYTTKNYLNNSTTNNENTTGPFNTTSYPLNTTEFYNNTSFSNTTSDSNHTMSTNITAKPEKTTQGFWEPPYMDYEVPQRSKNNIIVILVPIAGVLLLIFIAVVVYIMCKRSRDAKRKTMVPNSRNKANKNANTAQNNNKTILEKPQNPTDMFTTQSIGKYPAKYKTDNELNGTKKSNFMDDSIEDKLLREQFNNSLNSSLVSDTSKPKHYEPSEREKDLLNHLELSSIVIESDPNDPNRYFKKDDPGDWYRVIMKGKKPRDQNSNKEKEKKSGKKKSKNSGSEENSGERKHRQRKRMDKKQRSQSDTGLENSVKRKQKDRQSSSDSFDNTLNGDETILKASLQSREPRIVESKPMNKSDSVESDMPIRKKPQQIFSVPVAETKHEPVKARVIVSKPSIDVDSPPKFGNTATGSVLQINSNSASQDSENHTKRKTSISSSSSESFLPSNQQRNTPVRSSQTRNNLFGSSGKKIISTKESESDTKADVKRPDIVPPLNLSQTSDQVSRLDDDFEELLLSEC